MFIVEHYTTAAGRDLVSDFLEDVSKKHGTKDISSIHMAIESLRRYGLDANKYKKGIIKRLDKELWELRPGNNRIFFLCYFDERFVLLHGFRKQSQKTPHNEIETAKKQAKEYIRRLKNEDSKI